LSRRSAAASIFQVEVPSVDLILNRLEAVAWPLFMACEEKWYRAGTVETGQRQFLVQDPDGYLVRLAEGLGERPVAADRIAELQP